MIPKSYAIYKEFLEIINDGKEHNFKEIEEKLAKILNVTEEEREIRVI